MNLKTLSKSFYVLIILLLLIFGGLTAYSVLFQKNNFKLFVVQSGSMEPAIKTGSVVFVLAQQQANGIISPLPAAAYTIDDIITFESGKENTTHRVVSREEINGEFFYQTKGDANVGEDVEKVNQKAVLGKVIFSLPYLGYPVSFARTQMGYIFLIIVPGTIIVYSEILNIKKEVRKHFVNKRKNPELI